LGAFFVDLGQGCAGIDEIDAIFQGFQESQVIDGYHRGDCPATSAQEHTFVAECRAVDRIGESLSLLISFLIPHQRTSTNCVGSNGRTFVRPVQAVQWVGGKVN
jgi:hypothetical protein